MSSKQPGAEAAQTQKCPSGFARSFQFRPDGRVTCGSDTQYTRLPLTYTRYWGTLVRDVVSATK